MPQPIAIKDFPTVVRTTANSPYAELTAYVADLFTDEKRRLVEGFAEECKDDTEFGRKAAAIRNAAKAVGARAKLILRDGKLHGAYAGAYVTMSDEMKAQKAAARQANAASKALQANTVAKQAAGKK